MQGSQIVKSNADKIAEISVECHNNNHQIVYTSDKTRGTVLCHSCLTKIRVLQGESNG